MTPIPQDTVLQVQAFHIMNYDTRNSPYEGHYLHTNVETQVAIEEVQLYQGDFLIETNQVGNRYIVEMLDPRGDDSFFAWNFFDSMLQQKEWFSDYVFEEKAQEILDNNPDLKAEFEEIVEENPEGMHHWAQLYWIYQHSDFYENTFNRYPVFMYDYALKF